MSSRIRRAQERYNSPSGVRFIRRDAGTRLHLRQMLAYRRGGEAELTRRRTQASTAGEGRKETKIGRMYGSLPVHDS